MLFDRLHSLLSEHEHGRMKNHLGCALTITNYWRWSYLQIYSQNHRQRKKPRWTDRILEYVTRPSPTRSLPNSIAACKCSQQIELCIRLSVLRLFCVGHVVQINNNKNNNNNNNNNLILETAHTTKVSMLFTIKNYKKCICMCI